jgi:hypothetical protein
MINSGKSGLSTEFSSSIKSNKNHLDMIERGLDFSFNGVTTQTDRIFIENSFNGYDAWGSKIYLQIYIPNIDGVDLSKQPVIALVEGDTEDCLATAFQIDQNGIWQIITINEEFIESNLVWVISGNERVDDKGLVEPQFINSSEHINEISDRVNENFTCQVNTIEVWDRKECLLCGRADASIIGAAIKTTGCTDKINFSEKNFEKIARSEVGDVLDCTDPNENIIIDPNSGVKLEWKLGYVWFEKDLTGPKQATLSTCSSISTFSYKSQQTPWAIQDYTTVWTEPSTDPFGWKTTAFSYDSEVNQPALNIIDFRWRKVEN